MKVHTGGNSAPRVSSIGDRTCSCKKTNYDSLRYNSKKKGLVCFDMCECLKCLNIEFDKPEFEW